MRVLITGASGLIGQALARALTARGHQVIAAVRDPQRMAARAPMSMLAVDLASLPPAHWWAARLQGVDVVVNAVGIFRERRQRRFDNLHTAASAALFQGAVQAGVCRVVLLDDRESANRAK